jgi:hypothetical protein
MFNSKREPILYTLVIIFTVVLSIYFFNHMNIVAIPTAGTSIENATTIQTNDEITISPQYHGKTMFYRYKWDDGSYHWAVRWFPSFEIKAPNTSGSHCLYVRSWIWGKEYQFYYLVK